MPLQATSGAASYDAFGGGVPVVPNYIEEVFSTYLYTGTGATQTITNEIDLAGKGGLVWTKIRNIAQGHPLTDTVRGSNKISFSNLSGSQFTQSDTITSFNSTGYTLGADSGNFGFNATVNPHVSWTFRKQPKFFDIVSYTGTGSNATISHNLGSEPGCIIVKRTNAAGQQWFVYHRGTSSGNKYLMLNKTDAEDTGFFWNPTSTTFDVSSTLGLTATGGTYICYLFAHNAGGFGLTGTDNVISCGSFTGNQTAVNLGYEPQWILFKNINNAVGNWQLVDNMRGWTSDLRKAFLFANLTDEESLEDTTDMTLTSTGFIGNAGANNVIYIAIRRGPMKVPTSGTSVFTPVLGRSANPNYLAGFPVDLGISEYRVNGSNSTGSRLQGSNSMDTASTGAEASDGSLKWDFMNGYYTGGRTTDFISWAFRRAPSFFDEVCYTGTGSATTFNHNLGVVPELMIVKERNGANGWQVYSASLTNTEYLILNTSAGVPASSATRWNSTTPTSTVFSVGTHGATNGSGQNFVNYLFATCAGVSKVGSYTGNGTTQTINCGFTGGARFVLIKRTDAAGDWYVYDTARGMTTLTDPYLALNSTSAESATLGSVTTVSTGFALNSTILAAINVSAGTYIFLAIA